MMFRGCWFSYAAIAIIFAADDDIFISLIISILSWCRFSFSPDTAFSLS
jgi:hypothetical protein